MPFRINGLKRERGMATKVNLDSLIAREDFEVVTTRDDAPDLQSIAVRDLEKRAFFYPALRKPDFQRETSEWDPRRVANLIRTFLEGDLIPAVILWKHREYLFVIDGSHRLSAIAAWVHDDYGDGERSKTFFGDEIPKEQKRLAERTRALVQKEIGTYSDHVTAAQHPENFEPSLVAQARALASRVLHIQWVRGSAAQAEASFIRINQQAAMITPQELELIQGRQRPSVMAARAIIRRGTGHQYWSSFENAIQDKIRSLGDELYKLIFEPSLAYPIKTLDLPAGGAVYSAPALRMVYDFVGISVGPLPEEEDDDGTTTIEYLKRCKRVAELLLSNKPSSLGLHPAVYFYSWTGKQQPILFLTMALIVIEVQKAAKLPQFITRREALEQFIISNRTLLNQIVRKFGTKKSGQDHLLSFFATVFEMLDGGTPADKIAENLVALDRFSFLQPSEIPYSGTSPATYSPQLKSGVILRDLLQTAPRCKICGGLVPTQAMSLDHKQRLSEGGASVASNLQLSHPYCNTGYKEAGHAKKLHDARA